MWGLLSPTLLCLSITVSDSLSHTHQFIADCNRDLCQTSPNLSPCVGDVSWTGGESKQIVSVFISSIQALPFSSLSHNIACPVPESGNNECHYKEQTGKMSTRILPTSPHSVNYSTLLYWERRREHCATYTASK